MCYYENVLRESFDWIVFAINDPIEEKRVLTSLKAFFLPEWTKRALRGKSFEDAASMKVDAENNTDLTRSSGDMYGDIRLRLADTVERFIIRIGKQGVFESVG
jgi:phage tail sheath protein FI